VPLMPQNQLPRRSLYPTIEPYRRGRLQVSDLHEIYFEECGNPKGQPVVVLHGGPGGGSSPNLRRFHNPKSYRIILFDQRGCGRSTPHACLTDNTTWSLVADMEKLREHLDVERWQVFGGSWGSTLALAYAQTHKSRVQELVLRGIFAIQKSEVQWLYQFGASKIFPDAYAQFRDPIPEAERNDIIAAYHRRFNDPDEAVRLAFARSWSCWEGACLTLIPDPQVLQKFGEDRFALAFANIECHYFINNGFMPHDGALLDGMDKINDLEGVIVQGRYDVITPPITAFELAQRWPKAELHIIPDAGHSALEPGIIDALVQATDKFILADQI
jgi:proline iminopeptidase